MKNASLLLAVLMFVTGCAGFQSNNLPQLSESDLDFENVDDKLVVFSKFTVDSSSALLDKDIAASYQKKKFDEALVDSGCCEISDDSSESNLVLSITSTDHSNPAAVIPAFITGLSLYTIPSWVTETRDLEIEVDNRKGRTKTYNLKDSFVLVQWLPMMFAFPFEGGPIANGEELTRNVVRNFVVKLEQDDFLK
ncbi:MAG TPA: hypothetical protein VFN01_13630 [Marinobacter sp.]|uniref:hypothetical protein n=1 Tax=Marinobacter sp. TaxID=50741 RepID=UPI002D810127|nr:hypothetical protein [Marinobacter sp.]HET8802209.1 hypothetical protein [Marinobacter sp.]